MLPPGGAVIPLETLGLQEVLSAWSCQGVCPGCDTVPPSSKCKFSRSRGIRVQILIAPPFCGIGSSGAGDFPRPVWGGLSFQHGFSAVPPPHPPSERQHLQRGPDEAHGTGGRDQCPGRGRERGWIVPDRCQTRMCLLPGEGLEGPTRSGTGWACRGRASWAAQGVKKEPHPLRPSGNFSCWQSWACAMRGPSSAGQVFWESPPPGGPEPCQQRGGKGPGASGAHESRQPFPSLRSCPLGGKGPVPNYGVAKRKGGGRVSNFPAWN